MKYKNGKNIKYGDVCIVHPVKRFWPFRKGSITTTPYYIYIRQEHINWVDGKKLEFVTRIPDEHSSVINDYLINRLEYVGNLKQNPELFGVLLKQDMN